MSTHVPGFQLIFQFFLHHFVLAKIASSNIRVKFLSCTVFMLMYYIYAQD